MLPLILSPNRPLWPAIRICGELARQHPDSTTVHRLTSVYSTYASRNDSLAPVRAGLPDDAADIGFLADSNDTEYSLWRPFGRRRVVWLQDDVHPGFQIPHGVEWLVIKAVIWPKVSDQSLADWAAEHQAKIVATTSITTLVSLGAETWEIVHLEKH